MKLKSTLLSSTYHSFLISILSLHIDIMFSQMMRYAQCRDIWAAPQHTESEVECCSQWTLLESTH